MNRKTILAALLTATLGYTTSVSAQDVTIDQPGVDNSALVNQLGEKHAYIMQSGTMNNTWINQDNLNNHVNVNQDVNSFQSHAEVHQTGESNSTNIFQNELNSNTVVYQNGMMSNVNINHDFGEQNSAHVDQFSHESNVNTFTGYRNSINVMQEGTGNSATVNMN